MLQSFLKKEPYSEEGGFYAPPPPHTTQAAFGGHYGGGPSTVTSGAYIDIHHQTRAEQLHSAETSAISPLGVSLQGVSLTQVLFHLKTYKPKLWLTYLSTKIVILILYFNTAFL